MRILASNPDTLGDLILREPLYRALTAAGHELMLVVRRSVLPLAAYVAPGAGTVVLPYEPYAQDLERHWDEFQALFEAAREFRPDVLLVAPYRWTQFDEKLAAELPAGVRKVGMSGHLYGGDPHAGAAPVSRLTFDAVAEVCADQPEVEKNAALGAALLGAPPRPVEPRLAAGEAELSAARDTLGRLGLEPGGYWVACVGGTAHVALKTWHAHSWGRVLGEWAKRHGRRFLFVGLPEEEPAAREVLGEMGRVIGSDEEAARHAAVWMDPGGTLPELLALTQLSAGYVGHDTGPMHAAAAVGKPVLAVFGGGTWPRFRPAVEPSVALLVGVPCVGCGWVCTFEQPYCIKSVPADEVLRAADDLEGGRVVGREARVLEPDEELKRRMIREGAALARAQLREKAELSKQLETSYRQREADVAALHAARANDAAEAEALRGRLDQVHDEAKRAAEAFAAHDAARREEAEALRRELEARAAESARNAATLADRSAELERLREGVRGVVSGLATAPGENAAPAGVAGGDDVAGLRAAVGRLVARVRELEQGGRGWRRSLRQVLTDLAVGSRQYRRRPALPLPKVTVVTPVPGDADAAAVRATVQSVLAQDYHDLEYVVVVASADSNSTQLSLDLLAEFEGRIDRVLAEGGAAADAAARGLAAAAGDVLHLLHPGEMLEPGAAGSVAEYFARRPGVQAVYSEDATVEGGWKFAPRPRPTADVSALLDHRTRLRDGVFFRRWAYRALGPLKPEFGLAAEWELWVRLARRFELRRLPGHARAVPSGRPAGGEERDERYDADLRRAREAFEKTFGPAGRFRCGVIGLAHRVFDAARRFCPGRARGDGPLFFPPPDDAGARQRSLPLRLPLPRGLSAPPAPGEPVCPLTDRPARRFLFSTPDTTGGDRADGRAEARPIHQAYYDPPSGVVVAYPPVALERLNASYAARYAQGAAAAVVPPPEGLASPYARYRGGLLGKLGVADLLARVPSPYWWFERPRFDDVTADEVLRLVRGLLDPADAAARVLNVGCFEGKLLDRLKRETRWRLSGIEANPAAAAAARAGGHEVWEVAPQDAPLTITVGTSFDAILLTHTAEHLPDLLLVVRRLRQLLSPGGLVVMDQPNLDSAHARLFGPTWGLWQLPYHRTLMGRRAVRRLATLADMKVVRLRTRTHPYPACVSVQLNDLGLSAIVPDTARFPNDVASRGVRLTGWSRLLWDWRGRGDYLYAVLKAL